MKKLLAVYFSGTGNTAYTVNRFCSHISAAGVEYKIINIEKFDMTDAYSFNADTVLVAYPIYGSDMPRIVRDFILIAAEIFQGKDLITLVTQHSFSGDGGVLAARLIKNKRAHTASIHINLPSNISDATNIIKLTNGNINAKKISKANDKIERAVTDILSGKKIKDGKSFFSWASGFFGQRLMFRYFLEKRLRKNLKIDSGACSLCGKCAASCPMKNINVTDESISANGNCTLCYRCINLCPAKAISLISKKKPTEQYKGIGGTG